MNLNEFNMSVDNGDVNGEYFYMNSSTGSEFKNHSYIEYTKKIDEMYTNKCIMKNNGLTDGVGIDDMLPTSILNQCVNM